MEKWVPAALDYIPRWLEYQMRQSEQPGCVIAIGDTRSAGGKIVLEQAFGHADLDRRTPLTPRHRFRVASHSKSFTSAGIMKLREQNRLRLDDPVGRHVEGLHRDVAETTIAQVLSHSAGLVRDGWDSGQWQDRRPFLDAEELRADLAAAPIIDANTRFKYSNHGFGLAGMVIAAVTGERYTDWVRREIVVPAGLTETEPDMPGRYREACRSPAATPGCCRRAGGSSSRATTRPTRWRRRPALSALQRIWCASSGSSIRRRGAACCRWRAGAR